MTTTTSKYEMFPTDMNVIGGDGYDFMEAARKEGWAALSGWGRDGWDAGSWPYVILFIRKTSDGFQTMEYVEGDLTIEDHATKGDAYTSLDAKVHWHWEHSSDGPESFDKTDPRFCGPFSWNRLDWDKAVIGLCKMLSGA